MKITPEQFDAAAIESNLWGLMLEWASKFPSGPETGKLADQIERRFLDALNKQVESNEH